MSLPIQNIQGAARRRCARCDDDRDFCSPAIEQAPTVETSGETFVTSGSSNTNTYTPTELSLEIAVWDTGNSGTISKMEALAAIADYFKPGGGISKAVALAV